MVHVLFKPLPWFYHAIYASNDYATLTSLWEESSTSLMLFMGIGWLERGGVNEILRATNKYGWLSINNGRANVIKNCQDHCNLVDLGFKGCKYT